MTIVSRGPHPDTSSTPPNRNVRRTLWPFRGCVVPPRELAGVRRVHALSQEEDDRPGLARVEGYLDVERGARIHPRAAPAGKERPSQGRRARQRPVPPQELQAVPRRRERRIARVGEADPAVELLVVRVPGEDRSRGGIELRRHVEMLSDPGGPERPFVVGEEAQAARARGKRTSSLTASRPSQGGRPNVRRSTQRTAEVSLCKRSSAQNVFSLRKRNSGGGI